MESHASPFAFLLLPWACGFFGSFILAVLARACFPAREIESAFK